MTTSVLLATPLFGLSLLAPDFASLGPPSISALPDVVLAAYASGEDDEWGDDDWSGGTSEDSVADEEERVADEEEPVDEETEEARDASSDTEPASDEPQLGRDEYALLVRERSDLADTHRVLGLATWGAMTGSLVLGTIQYYNLYGFFSGQGSNPCVEGNAIFGQGQCSGTPWLHLGGGLLTAGLYTATFSLSLLMPDPNNLGDAKGAFADKLRLHKTLRWIHFGGMIAQMLLGYVIANGETFGLDRANDYGTLQALSTIHLGAGLVTWGAMTWAGALYTF